MNIKKVKDTRWLMSTDAYEIYSQCMYKPTVGAYGKEMEAILADRDCDVFVCTVEETPAGIAVFERQPGGVARIRGIAVRKALQRGGIGRFMVRAAALALDAGTVKAETDGESAAFYARTGFSVRRFTRHFPDGDAVRYDCTLDMNTLPGFEIHPTGCADLEGVRALWADGEVMKYVGFPGGLKKSPDEMAAWLERIGAERPGTDHFSVYFRGIFCGESYYSVGGEDGLACLDIKLFPFAVGRGLASRALRHAIGRAFDNGAVKCYVDPHPENSRAIALYRRLGMVRKEMPEALADPDYPGYLYFEIERKGALP